jgi:anti-anti-sigma factor
MDIQTKQLRRCDLLIAKGRIDSATVEQLNEALADVKKRGRSNIVLNLADVTYISSAGLGTLVETQKSCKSLHGELILTAVPERISEVLSLAGLTTLFRIFADDTEAIGSF